MPGPARAKVKVNGGVIGAIPQIHVGGVVHKIELAPYTPVEVAAGVLEVALKIAVAIVGGLKNPRVKIHAGSGVLATRLDDQVAVHGAREFVGRPDARARHEEKRVLGCVGTLRIQRSTSSKALMGKLWPIPPCTLNKLNPGATGTPEGKVTPTRVSQ